MQNRVCPYCHEKTISRKELILYALYIPGVVSECKSCHAVVSIKSSDTLLWSIVFEVVIVLLVVASINLFGSVWYGVALFVVWRLARLLAKSNAQLEYIR